MSTKQFLVQYTTSCNSGLLFIIKPVCGLCMIKHAVFPPIFLMCVSDQDKMFKLSSKVLMLVTGEVGDSTVC